MKEEQPLPEDDANKAVTLTTLPREILDHIFSYLDKSSLGKVARTCSLNRKIAKKMLLKKLLLEKIPLMHILDELKKPREQRESYYYQELLKSFPKNFFTIWDNDAAEGKLLLRYCEQSYKHYKEAIALISLLTWEKDHIKNKLSLLLMLLNYFQFQPNRKECDLYEEYPSVNNAHDYYCYQLYNLLRYLNINKNLKKNFNNPVKVLAFLQLGNLLVISLMIIMFCPINFPAWVSTAIFISVCLLFSFPSATFCLFRDIYSDIQLEKSLMQRGNHEYSGSLSTTPLTQEGYSVKRLFDTIRHMSINDMQEAINESHFEWDEKGQQQKAAKVFTLFSSATLPQDPPTDQSINHLP